MGVEKCERGRQLGALVGIVQRETGGRIGAPALDERDRCFGGAAVIQSRDFGTDLPKHASETST